MRTNLTSLFLVLLLCSMAQGATIGVIHNVTFDGGRLSFTLDGHDDGYGYGKMHVCSTDTTTYLDADGGRAEPTDFVEGCTVSATGPVLECALPTMLAREIRLVSKAAGAKAAAAATKKKNRLFLLEGTITRVEGGTVWIEDEAGRPTIVTMSPGTVVFVAGADEPTKSSLQVGMRLRVFSDGTMLKSFPGQVPNVSLVVAD